ncbi:hypothetical protein V5F63_19265 [Xanthobacter autotrophicus DSM 597]|uniref:hypothetical protein n=1 Tax=Xanthobacter wiegelii TaxID=3119913 RepID=UPI00372C7F4C
MSGDARLCVLFDAHPQVDPEFLVANLERVAEVFSGFADVVPILDATQSTAPDLPGALILSRSDIFDGIAHSKGDFVVPGNCDLKLLAAVSRLEQYSHFIRLEFDVWPTDIAQHRVREFCKLATSGAFGASYLRSQPQDAAWVYWPTLTTGSFTVPDDEKQAAFLPLIFFPRQFADFYAARLREGWSGHYEALMPTLARQAGLKLIDLGNSGRKFTLIEEFNVVPQSFSAPPRAAFVHPVKRLTQIDAVHFRPQEHIEGSPAEIEALKARLSLSNDYLEFGAGGSTVLACRMGVQTVTSIETDLTFCSDLIDRFSLRSYIDTGRLHLRHVHVGPTGPWGFPIEMPADRLIENYVGWPSKQKSADLILIDGRFRVAVAADCALSHGSDTTIMIHDYFDRPQYRPIEEFLTLRERVDSLAIFSVREDRRNAAEQIRQQYLHDMQ